MASAIQKIVVPIDFSEGSERAARYASALARRTGASLQLIHVLNGPAYGSGLFDLHPADAAARRERMYQSAKAGLQALVARLESCPDQIATEVRPGSTAESIAEAAVRYGASLVIMATHRKRGLSRVLPRSVAERVMRIAKCPVLVVRESGQVDVQRVRERERDSEPPSRVPQVKAAS